MKKIDFMNISSLFDVSKRATEAVLTARNMNTVIARATLFSKIMVSAFMILQS